MNFKFANVKLKESVEYYVDAIKRNDLIVFLDGLAKRVVKHNKGTHIVTLEDNKEYDLYTIYDSILTIYTVYDSHGNLSPVAMMFTVYALVIYISNNTKYHPYAEAITAVLNGNKEHYLAQYCKSIAAFGMMPDITYDEVMMCLVSLVVGNFVKPEPSRSGVPYFRARKDRKLWKKEYVFYVCYGSNLCEERFKCYITGKANKKLSVPAGEKCKDQTPIVFSTTLRIPYEMYFGNSSRTWKGGGVCFIKPTKATDSKKYSFARAYLITKEQYEHVWKRECKSPNWYGNEIDLNSIAGIPAKTFTSDYVHSFNMPCEEYLNVVRKGLIEWGLTYKQASQYLYVKTNNRKI